MPGESFRFIHASDFHLEQPLGDLDTLPSQLREAMAKCAMEGGASGFRRGNYWERRLRLSLR